MIFTTLNKIKAHGPCRDGWEKLLAGLDKTAADDDPLALSDVLRISGLEDTLWALRSVPEHCKEWRLLACDFAEHVLPLFKRKYPDDGRPREAIAVARRFAEGEASEADLMAAQDAAHAPTHAAAYAPHAAAYAADYAAACSASCAARNAASAGIAAAAAARATEMSWQKARLIEVLDETN